MRRMAMPLDLAAARRRVRRWADRIGPVGLVGVAILATCAGYVMGSIEPQRQQREALRDSASSAAAPRSPRASADDAAAPLLAFAAEFPPERELAALLGRLYAVGEREGVRLRQGEYQFVEADALGMVQYKVSLPVVASYPALRRFVAASLSEVPSLAITQINVQRERVGQGQLDARVELTLHMRASKVMTAGDPQVPADVSRAPDIERTEVTR